MEMMTRNYKLTLGLRLKSTDEIKGLTKILSCPSIAIGGSIKCMYTLCSPMTIEAGVVLYHVDWVIKIIQAVKRISCQTTKVALRLTLPQWQATSIVPFNQTIKTAETQYNHVANYLLE